MLHEVLLMNGQVKELDFLEGGVQGAMSQKGEAFVAYDEEAKKLYQIGFNSKLCLFVAYSELSIRDFRNLLEKRAKELIEQRIREAIEASYAELSDLYFAEYMLFKK